eukprot:1582374-Pyramimonas_sp.AAC.1
MLKAFEKDPHGLGDMPTIENKPSPIRMMGTGQYFVDWLIFASLGASTNTQPLVYVDLAAAWPSKISNTYLLDACGGFEGSLDAPRSALRLYPTPLPATCTILRYPVRQIKGCRRRATERPPPQWSPLLLRIVRENPPVLGNTLHSWKGYGLTPVECTTLEQVFATTKTRSVDFMSLDVEGSELVALKGIDFSKYGQGYGSNYNYNYRSPNPSGARGISSHGP